MTECNSCGVKKMKKRHNGNLRHVYEGEWESWYLIKCDENDDGFVRSIPRGSSEGKCACDE